MSRGLRHVWLSALRNVDAPECPSELTEPQFANLLFGKVCDVRSDAAILLQQAEAVVPAALRRGNEAESGDGLRAAAHTLCGLPR